MNALQDSTFRAGLTFSHFGTKYEKTTTTGYSTSGTSDGYELALNLMDSDHPEYTTTKLMMKRLRGYYDV
jgi:hypothetical protein